MHRMIGAALGLIHVRRLAQQRPSDAARPGWLTVMNKRWVLRKLRVRDRCDVGIFGDCPERATLSRSEAPAITGASVGGRVWRLPSTCLTRGLNSRNALHC